MVYLVTGISQWPVLSHITSVGGTVHIAQQYKAVRIFAAEGTYCTHLAVAHILAAEGTSTVPIAQQYVS
jgi:hypothetical protein